MLLLKSNAIRAPWQLVFLGLSGALDQAPELGEERRGIMGAGGGFGMILDAKDGFALMAHAFDGLVVEVDAVHGNIRRESPGVHSETVVLGGDFDFAGGEVFDGLIRT